MIIAFVGGLAIWSGMRASEAILWVDAVFLAAVIGWALVVAYVPEPDYNLIRRLFAATALGIGVFVLVWDVTAIQSSWIRVPVVALCFALIGVVTVEGFRWTYRASVHHTPSEQTAPTALLEWQIQEIKEINDFIGNKSEIQLRQTFDIPNILDMNIKFESNGLFPNNKPSAFSKEVDEAFKGSQARIDIRYANVSSIKNTAHVDWIPGKIGIINLTKKFVDANEKLDRIMSSSQLPLGISQSLAQFKDTIEHDMNLMIESMNESYQQDPDNINKNFDFGSKFYGVSSGLYWKNFSNLEPNAKNIRDSIQNFLKIK